MTRWIALGWLLAGLAPLAAQEPTSLRQSLGPVAPFTLTDQDGRPFSPEQLRGKVWLAHFFFTNCTQGCEKTIASMLQLQERFRGKRDVAFVSISVNPEHDQPQVLADFARDCKAEPGQWFFLRGPAEEVHRVVQSSFYQAAFWEPEGKSIAHSFNLVVVDRDGTMAGYVDGRKPENLPPLADRLRELARRRYVLPAVNAGLNGLSGVLLVAGYLAIRRRREALHKGLMASALACSMVFLTSYLYFHFAVLDGQPTRFAGPPGVRLFYLAVLLTHTVLAVAVAPLALYVTYQGLRDVRDRHVRVARWTFPAWLYVSVTGVVVYAMLYVLYPPY